MTLKFKVGDRVRATGENAYARDTTYPKLRVGTGGTVTGVWDRAVETRWPYEVEYDSEVGGPWEGQSFLTAEEEIEEES